MHSDVQERLYSAIKSVLISSKDHVTEEKIAQMTYLDFVIKESLRLIPVAFYSTRKVTNSLKLKNYTLPVGTIVVLPTTIVHTDEKIWGSDALEFRPEKFEKENIKKVHPYAYFPFSGGQRICPGMKYAVIKMKIFLSRFLMEYKVSTDLKYSELEFIMELTTRTKQLPILMYEKRE